MVNKFKIIFLNKENRKLFEEKWNEFVENSNASFESTLTFIDSMELNGFKNKSVLVLDKNNKIKGIFPLLEEKFFFLKRYKSPGFIGKINFKKMFPEIKKKLGLLGVYVQINAEQKDKEIEDKMFAYHFLLDLKDKIEEDVWKNDMNKKQGIWLERQKKVDLR